MDYKTTALETYANGFHCSQAVLFAFADDLGLDKEIALKIGGSFGGGLCCGETCGAVIGALMAIGLKYGHCISGDIDAKTTTNAKTLEFINKFKEQNGSIICRDLLGYDLTNCKDYKIIKEKNLFSTLCPKIIASALEITEKIIFDNK